MEPRQPSHEIDVAIVGAGPVGLALAALLARFGITNRVHERRTGLHRDPQAHVINTRTMEILRELGIERSVRAEAAPLQRMRTITWCESLAGRELGRIRLQGGDAGAFARRLAQSPTSIANLAQNRLEPMLLDLVAGTAHSEVRFGSEVVAVEGSADGVRIRTRENGLERRSSAAYVVACDGAGSPVRRGLGIEMDGPASLQRFVSIYFEADLERWIGARPGPLFWIVGARTRGVIIGFDLLRTWALMVPYSEPSTADDFTPEIAQRMVSDAIGDSAARFRITSVGNWNMSAQIATSYRSGRVFLAGDAAHRFPPTGGLGMNTGIQDAHNMAWKLAMVIRGEADAGLLDSYEIERRQVAQRNCEQSLRNAMRMVEVDMVLGVPTLTSVDPAVIARDETPSVDFGIDGDGDAAVTKRRAIQEVIDAQAEHFDFGGLDLGFRYDEGAVIADGSEPPPDSVQHYTPVARPGSRLPHVWLDRRGNRVSTLDLGGAGGFTLICGSDGQAWVDAARRLVRTSRANLRLVVVAQTQAGPGACLDVDGEWARQSGIDAGGALLVRPDGHVAWRTASSCDSAEAALETLRAVLSTLLSRPIVRDAVENAACAIP